MISFPQQAIRLRPMGKKIDIHRLKLLPTEGIGWKFGEVWGGPHREERGKKHKWDYANYKHSKIIFLCYLVPKL